MCYDLRVIEKKMADCKEPNMFIKFSKLGKGVTVTYKMFKPAFGGRALRRTGIICFLHYALCNNNSII
jgi:hypothetical protein